MKITVITGPDGEIHGTLSHPEPKPPGKTGGRPVVKLLAGPGQTAHELELPDHFAKADSAVELHKALKEHLGSRTKSGQ